MHDTQATRHHLRDLEDRRYQAMLDGDFDTFAALAHPDLRYTHSNGVVDSLQSYLGKCRDGYYCYLHLEHPIDCIQIIGDIALIHGSMSGELISNGVQKSLHNRALAVWVRGDHDWTLIAYQPTPFK